MIDLHNCVVLTASNYNATQQSMNYVQSYQPFTC